MTAKASHLTIVQKQSEQNTDEEILKQIESMRLSDDPAAEILIMDPDIRNKAIEQIKVNRFKQRTGAKPQIAQKPTAVQVPKKDPKYKFRLSILEKLGLMQLALIDWMFTNLQLAWALRKLLVDSRHRHLELIEQNQENGAFTNVMRDKVEKIGKVIAIVDEVLAEMFNIKAPPQFERFAVFDEKQRPIAKELFSKTKYAWMLENPRSPEELAEHLKIKEIEREQRREKAEQERKIREGMAALKSRLMRLVNMGLVSFDELMKLITTLYTPDMTALNFQLTAKAFSFRRMADEARQKGNDEEAYQLTWFAYCYAEAAKININEMRAEIEAKHQEMEQKRLEQKNAHKAKDEKLDKLIVRDRKTEEADRQAARAKKKGGQQKEGNKSKKK